MKVQARIERIERIKCKCPGGVGEVGPRLAVDDWPPFGTVRCSRCGGVRPVMRLSLGLGLELESQEEYEACAADIAAISALSDDELIKAYRDSKAAPIDASGGEAAGAKIVLTSEELDAAIEEEIMKAVR